MGAARLHGRNPHRPPISIGEELDQSAVLTVLSGIPAVTSTGPVVDAVRGDEGTVQQQMFYRLLYRVGDDVGQVECLGGEHVEGFVQVSVDAGKTDGVVAGQVSDHGALAHEPRQQDRLGEAAQDAAAAAGVDAGAAGRTGAGRQLEPGCRGRRGWHDRRVRRVQVGTADRAWSPPSSRPDPACPAPSTPSLKGGFTPLPTRP